jgi:cytidylate kinase
LEASEISIDREAAMASDNLDPGLDDSGGPPEAQRETPRHGFRGEGSQAPVRKAFPVGLTIAVSREAGSRGSTIAGRAARKLGWSVYNQELLEYTAREGLIRHDIRETLSAEAIQWADEQLEKLLREQTISQHPSIQELARTVLALGAMGEVVLIGRGAGLLLPRASTLHVRIIAPVSDRIAYMSQWLRLTWEQAAEQVRQRDSRRAEFLATHFHRQPHDNYQYDLILNSSLLGQDLSAELIAQASRAKIQSQQEE